MIGKNNVYCFDLRVLLRLGVESTQNVSVYKITSSTSYKHGY